MYMVCTKDKTRVRVSWKVMQKHIAEHGDEH